MIGRERYLQVAASCIVKLTIRVLRCRLNPGLQRFNADYIGNNRAVFQSIFRLKRVFLHRSLRRWWDDRVHFHLSFQKKFCIFRLLLTFKIMFRWSSKWELEFLLHNALRALPISILLCSHSQRARGTLFFGYISKDAFKGIQDSRCRVRATWLLSTAWLIMRMLLLLSLVDFFSAFSIASRLFSRLFDYYLRCRYCCLLPSIPALFSYILMTNSQTSHLDEENRTSLTVGSNAASFVRHYFSKEGTLSFEPQSSMKTSA